MKFLTVFKPEPGIFLLHWVLQIMLPALPLPFFLQEGRSVWLRKEIQREREEGLSAGGIARFCHPNGAKREDPPQTQGGEPEAGQQRHQPSLRSEHTHSGVGACWRKALGAEEIARKGTGSQVGRGLPVSLRGGLVRAMLIGV